MDYEFIKKQLESRSQELSFNASSLSNLPLEKRKEVEEKILDLCLMQNKTAFEYIPYIETINVESYLDDIDYFDIKKRNLVYLYLYFKSNNSDYLDQIDYKEIDVYIFSIMVKHLQTNANDNLLQAKISEIISVNPQYRSIINAIDSQYNKKIDYRTIAAGILGFAIGDALGVPAEFKSRTTLKYKPINDMIEYGSHYVPAGTWSDDTSMTIATMDSIIEKGTIDYNDIMKKYCEWKNNSKYTATNTVFDVGITIQKALSTYIYYGRDPIDCGLKGERNNGNGSLMRMLPIAFYLYTNNFDFDKEVEIVNNMSSLTHAHEVSKLGCKIYCDYIKEILRGHNKYEAYDNIKKIEYEKYYSTSSIEKYNRILKNDISKLSESDILSSGYIVDTLEAAIWCTLNNNTYEDAILNAVNLGNDTDTVGAITGSICGCLFGIDSIPNKWIEKLKKCNYLKYLCYKYTDTLNSNTTILKNNESSEKINLNYDYLKQVNKHSIDEKYINKNKNGYPEAKFTFINDGKSEKEINAEVQELLAQRNKLLVSLGYTINDDGSVVPSNIKSK